MRERVPDNKKRKKVAFTIDPDVYKLWVKYCEDNGVDNYSEYIENIIIEKLNK